MTLKHPNSLKLAPFKNYSKKKMFITIFTIICIFTLSSVYLYRTYAVFTENKQFNIIRGTVEEPGNIYFNVYVDDILVDAIPERYQGYTIDLGKSNCNNNVTLDFNYDTYKLSANFTNYVLSDNTKSSTKCNLYFTTRNVVNEILASYKENENCPSTDATSGNILVNKMENANEMICKANDDYGVSYYYRGSATNNYVYFKGLYWRIIRINGDKSVRLIYDGSKQAYANGVSNADRRLSTTSKYNVASNYTTYVGYMYGTTTSKTYDEAHTNTNNSTIKNVLDTWFESVFSDSDKKYLSDEIFCNDRTISSFATATNKYGYSNKATYYNWATGPWDTSKKYPNFKCGGREADKFTSTDAVVGNKLLAHPVGLPTADELVAAGGYNANNTKFYMYMGATFWTMTPYRTVVSNGSNSYIKVLNSNGNVTHGVTGTAYAIRPVINLKSSVLTSGNGTMSDPYRISGIEL